MGHSSPTVGTISDTVARLGLTRLNSLVSSLFDHRISQSTRSAYGSGQRQHLTFCVTFGLQPLPLSVYALCHFIAFLAHSRLSYSSISVPSNICTLQLVFLQSHQISCFFCIIFGQARQQPMKASCYGPPAAWLSLLSYIVGNLCSPQTQHRCLALADIAVDSHTDQQLLWIRIQYSKTDQAGNGTTIALGRTGRILCPVASAVLFVKTIKDSWTPVYVSGWPTEALAAQGSDVSHFSGHSFRIGAATTAVEVGISDALIKHLGRWKSKAYSAYIQPSCHSLVQLRIQLGSQLATRP